MNVNATNILFAVFAYHRHYSHYLITWVRYESELRRRPCAKERSSGDKTLVKNPPHPGIG